MGLPYITAKTDAMEELVENGRTGVFVNFSNPKDLAGKILILRNNPQLLDQISKSEIQLYQDRFKPKSLAQKLMCFIVVP